MADTALVIAAHPDDEVLGCGGTLAKLAQQGEEIHIAFLADGVSARNTAPSTGAADAQHAAAERPLAARRQAARTAAEILGATSVSFDPK